MLDLDMDGVATRKYISGVIMAVTTFISIVVNPCLIYYYKRFRTSWINRYYYYLGFAHLCYAIFRGVPVTCELLNDFRPKDFQWYMELLDIFAKVSSASVTTIVCMIVTVQHLNICHPGWTVIRGASRSGKYAFITIVSIYFVFSAPALVALFIILCKFEKLLRENPLNRYVAVATLIFYAPTLLFTLLSSCLYVITRAKFLTLNPEEDQIHITRKEFRSVGVFVIFGLVYMVFTITYFVLIFDKNADYFTIYFCGYIEVLAQRAIVACAIFFNDTEVRNFIFCRTPGGT